MRTKQCTMRPERGVPDTLTLVASTRELKLYSKYNEEMRMNFSRIKKRSYVCFRKNTVTSMWRPD